MAFVNVSHPLDSQHSIIANKNRPFWKDRQALAEGDDVSHHSHLLSNALAVAHKLLVIVDGNVAVRRLREELMLLLGDRTLVGAQVIKRCARSKHPLGTYALKVVLPPSTGRHCCQILDERRPCEAVVVTISPTFPKQVEPSSVLVFRRVQPVQFLSLFAEQKSRAVPSPRPFKFFDERRRVD